MDKIEEINGSIVVTRITIYNKKYLGTIQYDKYYHGRFDMYNEIGLIQTLYIKKDFYLTSDEINMIFENKFNTINYKCIEDKFNTSYVYLQDDIRIELDKFIIH